FLNLLDEIFRLVEVRNVRLKGRDGVSVGNFVGSRLVLNVSEANFCAFARKRLHDSAADTAASSGDDRNLSRKHRMGSLARKAAMVQRERKRGRRAKTRDYVFDR